MLWRRMLSRQQIRNSIPLAVSGFVHLLALVLLSLWLVPAIQRVGFFLNAAAADSDPVQIIDAPVPLAENLEDPPDADRSPDAALEPRLPNPLADAIHELLPTPDEPAANQDPQVVQAGALRQAVSVEHAVDGITAAIRGALDQGDLTVVWPFDASHSLVDDRQRIAKRLTSFLADTRDTPGELSNVVVSFGARVKEQVRATRSRKGRVLHSNSGHRPLGQRKRV